MLKACNDKYFRTIICNDVGRPICHRLLPLQFMTVYEKINAALKKALCITTRGNNDVLHLASPSRPTSH